MPLLSIILLVKIKQHLYDLGVAGIKAAIGHSNVLDSLQAIIDPMTLLSLGKRRLSLKLKSMLHQVKFGKS